MGNIKLRRIPRNELSYKSRFHLEISNVYKRNGSWWRIRSRSVCQIQEEPFKLTKTTPQNCRSLRRNEKCMLTRRSLHQQPQVDWEAGQRRQTIQSMRQRGSRRQKESRYGMCPQDAHDKILNT